VFHLVDIMETLVRRVCGVSGWASTGKINKCLLVDSAPQGSRHCFQESFPALSAGTHTHSLRQQSSYVLGNQLEQLGLPNIVEDALRPCLVLLFRASPATHKGSCDAT
jgi:hypothetical protein